MSAGDRIFVGLSVRRADALVLQPGSRFRQSECGYDTGARSFLIRPGLEAFWPQRGMRDFEHSSMFICDVDDDRDESGLMLLSVSYRGLVKPKKPKVDVHCDQQMYVWTDGVSTLVQAIPAPTVVVIYVTTTPPNMLGVGGYAAANNPNLLAPPQAKLTNGFEPAALGYAFVNREWPKTGVYGGPAYEVTERYEWRWG